MNTILLRIKSEWIIKVLSPGLGHFLDTHVAKYVGVTMKTSRFCTCCPWAYQNTILLRLTAFYWTLGLQLTTDQSEVKIINRT